MHHRTKMAAKSISGVMTAAAIAVAVAWLTEVVRQRPAQYEREPIRLASTLLHTGDHLGLPAGIESVGSRLVVIDRRGEHNVHVVDMQSGALVGSVGRTGEGPTEFRGPTAIARDRGGRAWVLDALNQRMTRLDLGRLAAGDGWMGETFRLASSSAVTDVMWTAEAGMLAAGHFLNGRYGRLSASGELRAEAGSFPPEGAGRPAFVNQQLYQVRLGAHPDGAVFAAAAIHAGRIDFVDANGMRIGGAEVPVPFDPVFVVDASKRFPVARFDDESPRGYLDVAVTGDLVFGLFSGRTEADYAGREMYATDVHVFEWSGALVEILRLDRDVAAIEVDDDSGRLYAIQHDPMPGILEFELPADVRPGTRPVEIAAVPATGDLR